MLENSQRSGLPVPGVYFAPRAGLIRPGAGTPAVSVPSWIRAARCSVSSALIDIVPSPIHAATLTVRGVPARPPWRWPGRRPGYSDGLRRGADRYGGQPHEDPQPDHQAQRVAERDRGATHHVCADLYRLVGGRDLADPAENAVQREPYAAEDGEDEVQHQGDRLHLLGSEPVADGHGQRREDGRAEPERHPDG